MGKINPIRIPGRWKEGYALDFHIASSVYLGEDQYGHSRFDTTRTEVGELLYRLKYGGDKSVIDDLVATAAHFVQSWRPRADVLIPAPPSRPRPEQPLFLFAEALAGSLGLSYAQAAIKKARETPELKDVHDFDQRTKLLWGAFEVDKAVTDGKSVLLVDDLFRSGATLNAIAALLYDEGRAREVFALTITRTRSHR